MATLFTIKSPVDYDELEDTIQHFLLEFKISTQSVSSHSSAASEWNGFAEEPRESQVGELKYMKMLQEVAERQRDIVYIDLKDIQINANILVSAIEKNAKRFVELFCRCIDKIMPTSSEAVSLEEEPLDVIQFQRLQLQKQRAMSRSANDVEAPTVFPPELLRRYNLYFIPLTDFPIKKSLAVREIKASDLGQLITIRGLITRVSDVKPNIQVAAFTCDRCGYEVFQELKGAKQFLPVSACPSEKCVKDNARGQLFPSTRASKFVAFQEARIQELTSQVPVGHIPRSITIYLYGSICRSANPGDLIDCAGIYLPTPYTGFKAVRAGLLTDTYIEAHVITRLKKQYDETPMTDDFEKIAEDMQKKGNLYEELSQSIAPEIFGLNDVKKILLLQLIGGVTKQMGDGMKIRGDINVCLMGDPGVAKSQLLKYIAKAAPRGVYTTGRGSSGVGLTAAIMKDPVNDEKVLEGGALVLADNGICCIDEFDKMDESDRTAIHEVMEQQTISIAKAGITTTLNARTSVLAAANPLYGRYNPKVSPLANINLPAALLSRFDILYLILDVPERDDDERLARHIAYVHMNNKPPEGQFATLDSALIRRFIAKARTYRPVIPKSLSDYCVGIYVRLRQAQKEDERRERQFAHTTPRTLLAVTRLSQALARLRFSDTVTTEDVDEALRLIEVSKSSVYDTQGQKRDYGDSTSSTKIYRMLRSMLQEDETGSHVNLRRARERCFAKGFTEDQFQQCIKEYEDLGIWQVELGGTSLVFIDNELDDQGMD